MDHVPDWKGPPAKYVCKPAPALTEHKWQERSQRKQIF